MGCDLVVIGTSWGGLDALQVILSSLVPGFPVPIAVAQHRGKDGDDGLVEVLQRSSPLPIQEVEDKQPLVPGRIFLAPADYHVLVEGNAFALSTDPPVSWARPSIDVLFESAADAFAGALIGVILTGAGKDGAAGLARVKERGGLAVVQDPETAKVRALPDAAIAAAGPARVLPLNDIPELLLRTCFARQASGA